MRFHEAFLGFFVARHQMACLCLLSVHVPKAAFNVTPSPRKA